MRPWGDVRRAVGFRAQACPGCRLGWSLCELSEEPRPTKAFVALVHRQGILVVQLHAGAAAASGRRIVPC
ncbi:hypothetical protein AURDEDRAFT_115071, partial [Auricularia subglabra TFB-10046 SS5]